VICRNLAGSPWRLRRKARPTLELVLAASAGRAPVGVVEAALEGRRGNQADYDLMGGEST
jgi:hypothetical protein